MGMPRIAPWSFFTKNLRARLDELSKVIGTSSFFIVTMQDGFFTMIRLFHKTDGADSEFSSSRISDLTDLQIMQSTQPVVVGDTKNHPKGKALYDHKIGAYMGAPIILGDGTLYGTLGTANLTPYEFTQTEFHALQLAAGMLSYIIDLERTAIHDPLTGALNRLFLDRHMKTPTDEFGESFAMIYIDLDGFKKINDTYGHESGDSILRVIVQRLKRRIRMEDIVVRVGGDEFVVILTDLSSGPSWVGSAVNRLYKALDVEYGIGMDKFRVSVSMGISTYPENGTDVDALMQAADAAMYSVKKRGGQGYQVCTPETLAALTDEIKFLHHDEKGVI